MQRVSQAVSSTKVFQLTFVMCCVISMYAASLPHLTFVDLIAVTVLGKEVSL
jgi:hypothetical protein